MEKELVLVKVCILFLENNCEKVNDKVNENEQYVNWLRKCIGDFEINLFFFQNKNNQLEVNY